MFLINLFAVWIAVALTVDCAEQDEHRDFQYNSVVDSQTGRYNFAYDTGNDNEIAHSLHMQYRDANGVVRGRYGYTDPRGKLRMVEYEAGPNGFVARGDVGPDMFPHDNAPEQTTDSGPRSYSMAQLQTNDFDLVPRPVQMAGWDPAGDPMGQPVTDSGSAAKSNEDKVEEVFINGYPLSRAYPVFPGGNVTDDDANVTAYAVPPEEYDDRYPRVFFSSNENAGETESENYVKRENEMQTEIVQGVTSSPLTVNNIDVNPDDIRAAANDQLLRRSARDGTPARVQQTSLPYSYRNYRQSHDHDNEVRYYRGRYTHDHDAEARYRARQTHDHDAETRYRGRQTHDHDSEVRYYPASRYVRGRGYWIRPAHTHSSEDPLYHRRVHSYSRYTPRRIYYRDDHSMVPHEHYSSAYRNENDRDHQHSDVHLYGRSQNYAAVYPATVKPRQLKYIPADKYHDKYYYWSND
ncbi:uncharacterized protein LOC129221925 [Uloborus diversus]|uniref:uncharacterized protein LOC129221925 n=1 Tax=Uloborus diversus TaxID=327109 RepID=UPI00240A10F1|nr:uncharacterized protein LOC129221925 [Uloborus diversus]